MFGDWLLDTPRRTLLLTAPSPRLTTGKHAPTLARAVVPDQLTLE